MSLVVDIEKKLKDITLKIAFETQKMGDVTGILGASGCGKSMTLKCIAGIVTPDRGRIVLNDRVLFDSEKKIHVKTRDRKVGYLFQNYALFPNMTVRRNVELALPGSRKEKETAAARYLELLSVGDLAENYPARLSGGQQQRVALARILASKPDVLMLDEPFSALDYYLKEKLQLELLNVLNIYQGDILMVTHNRDEIYRFCRQIYVLDQGRVAASGETKAVFREPQSVAAAKLTGCKNIEAAEVLADHELRVPAWKAVIKLEKSIPAKTRAIGIRAHDFRLPQNGETVNVFPCVCRQLLEDPFEVTIIMDNDICWKIPGDIWRETYGQKVPERFKIPGESILFLE